MKNHISASAVDLFCGIGGLTRGLIKSGIPVNAGIDMDESCKYAFEKNNRTSFIGADIKNVSANRIKSLYPSNSIKILVGCAPCQPFSTHTQKNENREEDEQWGLLYHFARIIK